MSAMSLHELLAGVLPREAVPAIDIRGMTLDSRAAGAGDAFVALRGTRRHGIDFAAAAVDRGAVVVLAEAPQADAADPGVPVLWVPGLREKLGDLAARFHGHPSRGLTVIGVTGTNGKTSTVQMLAQALSGLGHVAASIGTLGSGVHGDLQAGERTTPDAISLQAQLAAFAARGVSHVAMEVSSHALEQGRVNGIDFDIALFTNLTRDHLDYHGTMEAYGAAKEKLFAMPGLKAAVVNVDDAFGSGLAGRLSPHLARLRVSLGSPQAEVRASAVKALDTGLAFQLHTPWGEAAIHSPLLGRFNVSNLLMVGAALGALGVPFEQVVQALQALQPVPGRMSRLGGGATHPLLVVDYAHTPDALEQALDSVRAHSRGHVFCVFGCGGERDPGKRPLMGQVAERLADRIIITDDNPRDEDGNVIVSQILEGLVHAETVAVERDRAAAIAMACREARPGDVVLIAGKGHETYQESHGVKRPFDDLEVARRELEALA